MKNNLLASMLGVFAIVTAAGLGHVSLRYRVIQVGYATADKLEERRQLEEENRRLRLEQSLLRNPARIERIARERLGMDRPDPARIRLVHPGVREVAALPDPAEHR